MTIVSQTSLTKEIETTICRQVVVTYQRYGTFFRIISAMGGSPGDVSEDPVR